MAAEAGTASSADQAGSIAGILFVALQVGGWVLNLTAYPPSSNESPAFDYDAFFAEPGNRWRAAIGSWLMLLAGVVLLVFLLSLHRRMLEAGPAARMSAKASLASGVVYVVLHLVGTMTASVPSLVVPLAETMGGPLRPDSGVMDLFQFLGLGMLFVPGLLAAAVCVAATSAGGSKANLLPKWLKVGGYVVATSCLFGVVVYPYVFWLLWVLVVAMMLQPGQGARPRGTDVSVTAWPGAPDGGGLGGPVSAAGQRESLGPYLREPGSGP